MDSIVALAVSMTTNESDYEYMKNFVHAGINRADIERGTTQLGFFVFDTAVRTDTLIHLNEYTDRTALHTAVDNIGYSPSAAQSQVSVALVQILNMTTERRENRPLTVYIILDEETSLMDASSLADQMRNMNIIVTFVSVGFSDINSLKLLAFAPSPAFVWNIPDFFTFGMLSSFLFKDNSCSE